MTLRDLDLIRDDELKRVPDNFQRIREWAKQAKAEIALGGGGGGGPHAASHQNGGGDEISVAGLSGLLADPQTPTAHAHAGTDITSGIVPPARLGTGSGGAVLFLREDSTWQLPGGGGGDNITINGAALVDADFDDATPAPPAGEVNVKWQKDAGSPANVSASVQAATTAVKGVVELATSGENAANVVVQGNDARLSDARTPLAHVHDGADITTGTVVPARLGSGSGGATKFLREDSTFQKVTTGSLELAYNLGAFTIPTENYVIMSNHLKITGANRVAVEGTARLRIT